MYIQGISDIACGTNCLNRFFFIPPFRRFSLLPLFPPFSLPTSLSLLFPSPFLPLLPSFSPFLFSISRTGKLVSLSLSPTQILFYFHYLCQVVGVCYGKSILISPFYFSHPLSAASISSLPLSPFHPKIKRTLA